MRTIVKILSVILLLVNGTGAFYGGYLFISDPSGSRMQIPLSYLEHSPFNDYLIPGIVLIVVNGVFSFVALFTLIMKTRNYPWFIIAQGVLLGGWIIIQMLMLRMFYAPFHATFLAIGTFLILCGWYLKKSAPIS